MEHALKGVPVQEPPAPEGVVNSGGEWFYDEFAKGGGVRSVGLDSDAEAAPAVQPLPPSDEKKRIMDLFKN